VTNLIVDVAAIKKTSESRGRYRQEESFYPVTFKGKKFTIRFSGGYSLSGDAGGGGCWWVEDEKGQVVEKWYKEYNIDGWKKNEMGSELYEAFNKAKVELNL
jgi:hypothetical protein